MVHIAVRVIWREVHASIWCVILLSNNFSATLMWIWKWMQAVYILLFQLVCEYFSVLLLLHAWFPCEFGLPPARKCSTHSFALWVLFEKGILQRVRRDRFRCVGYLQHVSLSTHVLSTQHYAAKLYGFIGSTYDAWYQRAIRNHVFRRVKSWFQVMLFTLTVHRISLPLQSKMCNTCSSDLMWPNNQSCNFQVV